MHRAPVRTPSVQKNPRGTVPNMACASIESPVPRSTATFSWSPPPMASPPPYDLYEAFPAVHPNDPRNSHSTRPASGFYQGDTSRYPGPRRPAGPSLSIPHLREALSSLDSKMASLLSEREVLECKLEQAVRLQSPVQRLPNELLASIFVIGVLGTEEEDTLVLSTIMLVCRHWKDVAINTPILWTQITAGTRHSMDKARRKLERSKSAMLHISVDFSPRVENTSVTTESIVRTMELLRTSIWRWKSFRMTVPNRPQANAALRLCKDEAPVLETLSIRILHSMQEDHYSHAPLPIFAGRLPSIKSTSFTSFNFGWDMSLVTGLRVLKLGGYWNGFSPSVDAILTILRNCPQLEELALRNMSDVDPDSCGAIASDPSEQDGFTEKLVRVTDSRTINLPRLSKASFYYSGILRTRTILSLLSFPALERIELCFLDNVSPVIEHLRRQSLTTLPLKQIRIESSFFNELKLVRLLRRIPALNTLELVDVEDASSNLLKNLSTPPSAQTWICPKLIRLTLEGCTTLDWDALRGFVESRLPAHSRAYPRQLHPPVSSSSTPPVSSASSSSRPLRPTSSTTSSASAFAAQAHILARVPVTPQTKGGSNSLGWPQRLQFIDLTRCHQISKEMVQWLRMYVSEVKCETVKGVWGEPTST